MEKYERLRTNENTRDHIVDVDYKLENVLDEARERARELNGEID